jgi:hypothetical protein
MKNLISSFNRRKQKLKLQKKYSKNLTFSHFFVQSTKMLRNCLHIYGFSTDIVDILILNTLF